jgi:hypothetical protein
MGCYIVLWHRKQEAVLRIRRIRMFLGHPDPLVRGMDPDPDPYSVIKQK